jgi:diaminopimelate epimerase
MGIPFVKYQGTGNDFVLVDQREQSHLRRSDTARIARMCDRHFGIGADGLILLEQRAGFDFEMVYFNADGQEGTMCGNGGRCTAAFAKSLGIVQEQARFLAVDGEHEAKLGADGWVELKMGDVLAYEQVGGDFVLHTGSPHFVTFVKNVAGVDVRAEGRKVRYSDAFEHTGVNVNFVERCGQALKVATYERGVEDETLSCGTGITASALAFALQHLSHGPHAIDIESKGGQLVVRFDYDADGFSNVWLCGPATFVFEGVYPV